MCDGPRQSLFDMSKSKVYGSICIRRSQTGESSTMPQGYCAGLALDIYGISVWWQFVKLGDNLF